MPDTVLGIWQWFLEGQRQTLNNETNMWTCEPEIVPKRYEDRPQARDRSATRWLGCPWASEQVECELRMTVPGSWPCRNHPSPSPLGVHKPWQGSGCQSGWHQPGTWGGRVCFLPRRSEPCFRLCFYNSRVCSDRLDTITVPGPVDATVWGQVGVTRVPAKPLPGTSPCSGTDLRGPAHRPWGW